MSISPARRVAFKTILRVFEQEAYADRVFASEARRLGERDRALAQRLAFGTVQRVRTLDHAINELGKKSPGTFDPPVRAALRLGAYQLAFAAGIPAHAAVNESVELVREYGPKHAVGFTNAIMRRLSEGALALVENLPEWTPGEAGTALLLSRLDRRDLLARARPRRRPGALARAKRAGRDGGAQKHAQAGEGRG